MSKVQNILGSLGIRKPAQVAKAAKKASVAVSKPVAKEAKGAEALAAQNKAMVEMKSAKLKATSDGYGGGGYGGGW